MLVKSKSRVPSLPDHDYCTFFKENLAKEQLLKTYDKIPSYCQVSKLVNRGIVTPSPPSKKDSGVESDGQSDFSTTEISERKVMPEDEPEQITDCVVVCDKNTVPDSDKDEKCFNKLPEYITDMTDSQQKTLVDQQSSSPVSSLYSGNSESSLDSTEIKQPMKRKLNLLEYRKRLLDGSYSKKRSETSEKSLEFQNTSRQKRSEISEKSLEFQNTSRQLLVPFHSIKEEKIELSHIVIKEEKYDDLTIEIQGFAETLKNDKIKVKQQNVDSSNSFAYGKCKTLRPDAKVTSELNENHAQLNQKHDKLNENHDQLNQKHDKLNENHDQLEYSDFIEEIHEIKTVKKEIIEVDLAKDEEQEENNMKCTRNKNISKILQNLPLSKMPVTSLGHSLLCSNDDLVKKRSSSSQSTDGRSTTRRSRSRSGSSKRDYSYRKDRHSKKPYCRRSQRCRSRDSRSRSKSRYSAFSRSRSRSRSRSASYYSRSRTRSKSKDRKRKSYRSRERDWNYTRNGNGNREHRGDSNFTSWNGWTGVEAYDNYDQWSESYSYGMTTYGYSRQQWCNVNDYGPTDVTTGYRNHAKALTESNRVLEDRRVIYVRGLPDNFTKSDLRKRFEKFGPIEDISVFLREKSENYGFVTFERRSDAFDALEHANDDKSLPQFYVCFGGRRNFCRVEYSDLDAQNEDYSGGASPSSMDFDSLLQMALKMRR